MPYIPDDSPNGNNDRWLHTPSMPLARPFTNVGQLNFAITKLIDMYLSMTNVSYTSINAAIGVLECAKLELYRRIAAPYEDIKLAENGDVYDCIPKEIDHAEPDKQA